jgi:hypothetical protein
LIIADCFAVVGRREKCHDIQVIPPPASRDLLADSIPAACVFGVNVCSLKPESCPESSELPVFTHRSRLTQAP